MSLRRPPRTPAQLVKADTMKTRPILIVLAGLLWLPVASGGTEAAHQQVQKITAAIPQCTSVALTERYFCQIHSKAHTKVRALQAGR